MTAGWHPDPTGRFGARYFDGAAWTDQVQGANGQVTTDALERSPGATPPPPPAPAPPAWGPPGGGYAPAAPAPLAKATGFLGLALAGLGWLLAATSLLLFNWGDGVSRGDIADVAPDPFTDGIELADSVTIMYVQWAGFALLALVLLGLGAALLGLIGRDPTVLRFLVGGLAGFAAIVHAFAVVRALRDNVELGAHLGTLGYLVAIAGLAIGAHTRRTT
jgi:hypothetical protein